jgi:maleate isomerase
MTEAKPKPTALTARQGAVELDARPLQKRVGLLVLSTDHTTEPDFRRMVASDGIGVYANRIAFSNPTTPESLRDMQPSLAEGAALILPGEELDAICYSCSSASMVMGDEEVEAAIGQGKPGTPVVTPAAAAVRGLRQFGASRISILAPYTRETSAAIAGYFEDRLFDIRSFVYLGLEDDREMARISPEALIRIAAESVTPNAEALVIACTALRAAPVAAAVERETGRPVVTSNLASAWNCLRLCGDLSPRLELGSLMTLQLPD